VKKLLTRVLTFIGGAFFILEFVLPDPLPGWLGGGPNPLSSRFSLATDIIVVLGTMAFLLGPINLARSHVVTLVRRRKGWLASLVFLVFLVVAIVFTTAHEFWPEKQATTAAYDLLFYGVGVAFGATSMALLTFYLVSAAYRSFRLNSLASAVMFVAAAIVLLGRSPLGDWLTKGLPDRLQLHSVQDWIMATPNGAVQRAVLIGVFAGAFAAALRFWLGLGGRTEQA
jgi:hypothetical protein